MGRSRGSLGERRQVINFFKTCSGRSAAAACAARLAGRHAEIRITVAIISAAVPYGVPHEIIARAIRIVPLLLPVWHMILAIRILGKGRRRET